MTGAEKYTGLEAPGHVRLRKVHGEAMLLDLKTRDCFGLNAVGLAIWDRIAEHGEVESVIRDLLQEFDVDEATLSKDVRDLVDALLARGLLVSSSRSSK